MNQAVKPTKTRAYMGAIGDPGSTIISLNSDERAVGTQTLLPSGATVQLSRDGAYIYAPPHLANETQAFLDQFVCQVRTDGTLWRATTSVSIEPPSRFPRVHKTSDSNGQTIRVEVLTQTTSRIHLSEAVGTALRKIIVLEDSSHGSSTASDDGTLTFTPTVGFEGPTNVHFLAECEDGTSTNLTLTIEVRSPVRIATSRTNLSR